MIDPRGNREAMSSRLFVLLAIVVCLVSLALREQFVQMTTVEYPIRGDIIQYRNYAQNLLQHRTFSSADPDAGAPAPDAFRGPGYPLVLAAAMAARPVGSDWYPLALQFQVLLGGLTTALGMALGRMWLSRVACLGTGLLMALWPHHVAATGALLSEVVFAFVLMLALWTAARAYAAPATKRRWGVGAGCAFAYAYLVNPIALLLPPLVAIAAWKERRTLALALLLLPGAAALAWSARSLALPSSDGPGRATINIVQGSWPDMQVAMALRFTDPGAAAMVAAIDAESRLLAADPDKGMRVISARLGADPVFYLRWYLLEKPYLLWDWGIRIGAGDVYFLEVQNSPLEANPVLRTVKAALKALNFPFFLLAAAASVAVLLRRRVRAPLEFARWLPALAFAYFTFWHVVFQAEPRYAIAYRPIELLLVSTALAWLAQKAFGGRRGVDGSAQPSGDDASREAS